ncbi:unnamed protein product [Pedinophyceae sp. YPF-701]|nr:unnamed protein product [Pedinophyceae sp. YPF-701]
MAAAATAEGPGARALDLDDDSLGSRQDSFASQEERQADRRRVHGGASSRLIALDSPNAVVDYRASVAARAVPERAAKELPAVVKCLLCLAAQGNEAGTKQIIKDIDRANRAKRGQWDDGRMSGHTPKPVSRRMLAGTSRQSRQQMLRSGHSRASGLDARPMVGVSSRSIALGGNGETTPLSRRATVPANVMANLAAEASDGKVLSRPGSRRRLASGASRPSDATRTINTRGANIPEGDEGAEEDRRQTSRGRSLSRRRMHLGDGGLAAEDSAVLGAPSVKSGATNRSVQWWNRSRQRMEFSDVRASHDDGRAAHVRAGASRTRLNVSASRGAGDGPAARERELTRVQSHQINVDEIRLSTSEGEATKEARPVGPSAGSHAGSRVSRGASLRDMYERRSQSPPARLQRDLSRHERNAAPQRASSRGGNSKRIPSFKNTRLGRQMRNRQLSAGEGEMRALTRNGSSSKTGSANLDAEDALRKVPSRRQSSGRRDLTRKRSSSGRTAKDLGAREEQNSRVAGYFAQAEGGHRGSLERRRSSGRVRDALPRASSSRRSGRAASWVPEADAVEKRASQGGNKDADWRGASRVSSARRSGRAASWVPEADAVEQPAPVAQPPERSVVASARNRRSQDWRAAPRAAPDAGDAGPSEVHRMAAIKQAVENSPAVQHKTAPGRTLERKESTSKRLVVSPPPRAASPAGPATPKPQPESKAEPEPEPRRSVFSASASLRTMSLQRAAAEPEITSASPQPLARTLSRKKSSAAGSSAHVKSSPGTQAGSAAESHREAAADGSKQQSSPGLSKQASFAERAASFKKGLSFKRMASGASAATEDSQVTTDSKASGEKKKRRGGRAEHEAKMKARRERLKQKEEKKQQQAAQESNAESKFKAMLAGKSKQGMAGSMEAVMARRELRSERLLRVQTLRKRNNTSEDLGEAVSAAVSSRALLSKRSGLESPGGGRSRSPAGSHYTESDSGSDTGYESVAEDVEAGGQRRPVLSVVEDAGSEGERPSTFSSVAGRMAEESRNGGGHDDALRAASSRRMMPGPFIKVDGKGSALQARGDASTPRKYGNADEALDTAPYGMVPMIRQPDATH